MQKYHEKQSKFWWGGTLNLLSNAIKKNKSEKPLVLFIHTSIYRLNFVIFRYKLFLLFLRIKKIEKISRKNLPGLFHSGGLLYILRPIAADCGRLWQFVGPVYQNIWPPSYYACPGQIR